MDISALVKITAAFKQFVGESLADLTRRQEAEIDWELLRLKRSVLAENLERAKSELVDLARKEKANKVAGLSSRGLGNSTIIDSFSLAIEKQSADELDRMQCEYNRAIEEFALYDRKISFTRKVGFWGKIRRIFSSSS